MFRLLKDSRGIKSWHLTLGVFWTTVFSVKALVSGVSVTIALGSFTTASFAGAEYLLYITPWLAAMGTREWIEKSNGHP
jgi:hypothetical protein